MADTKIKDLSVKGTVASTDELLINDVAGGDLDKKITPAGIKTFVKSGLVASDVTDFDTEVSNNSSVAANTAKVTNATHTGDVTGSVALTIAAGAIDIAMHSATGTPGATTYYRGDNTWATIAGGGDALTTNPLSQFAATTSLELKGVISDETGSGALVFATSPTLVTPALGTPSAIVLTNATGTAASLTAGTVTTNANLTGDVTSVGNATTIAVDAVDIAMLSATGTPDVTTFLRGDNTWATPAGSGDMVLASAQTNTGIKTFLDTTMKLRNVANTFDGYFVNTNTADRIYTLQDSSDTLVGRATTDTLTNKTINTASNTLTVVAADMTDYASATATFTNKSIDQDGTGNSITNIDVASIKAGSNILISDIPFIIDGGGSAITTGIKGDIVIDFDCTINSVTMLADTSGSVVVDIWKDTYANYPPTDADTITASAVPTITTAVKSQDATLTGWTTTITAGDTLRFNVDSADTITRVLISLKVTKTA